MINSAYYTGGTATGGFAIYNFPTPLTTFSFLWGSPDSYNTIQFFALAGGAGSGSPIATIGGTNGNSFTGSNLANCCGSGFDLVSFLATGGTIGSIELTDSGEAAFEYSNVATTPLPAALPLFAGGLGLMGLLGGRRKRKSKASLAAA